MGRSEKLAWGLAWTALVGCGGNALSQGDPNGDVPGDSDPKARGEDPKGQGTGGQSPGPAPGGQGGSMLPGFAGTSGSAGSTSVQPGPPGICTKLCVPTASFLFDSHVSVEMLLGGSLHACRELTGECYVGTPPSPGSGGNSIEFRPAVDLWRGPSAFSTDDWQTIRFGWSALEGEELRDGERFTFNLIHGSREYGLLDQRAHLEAITDCAGTCLHGFADLRNDGSAGAPSWEVGGESAGGASGDAAGAPPGGERAGGAAGAAP